MNPPISSGIIDPHLHLFALNKGHYHWLKTEQAPFWPDKALISRDFSEQDLQLPVDLCLKGFVHIEAGFDNQQPWREIEWLETHCQLPFRSVAFADLCADDFPQTISKLKAFHSVVGIRHILDDQALAILNNKRIHQHFSILEQNGWRFDAQLDISDGPATEALMQLSRHFPAVPIIVNHGGWPPSCAQPKPWQQWADSLQKLSEHANIAVKMSGWEMNNRHWQMPQVIDSMLYSLQIFGTRRVMLASNFPLCTFSFSYGELWRNYREAIVQAQLGETVWQQLSADNAAQWYQLT